VTVDAHDDPYQLLEGARGEPAGPGRIAAFERAASAADLAAEEALAYEIRDQLIQACEFGGAADRAIGHYGQMLKWADDHPDVVAGQRLDRLLWKYKWIAATLPLLASVQSSTIDAALDDMQRRFEVAGSSRSPVEKVRWRRLMAIGELESALDMAAEWWANEDDRGRRSRLSDCMACDSAEYAHALSVGGRHEDALRVAQPIFDRTLGCMTVPEDPFGQLLPSLLAEGRLDEAASAHVQGWDLIAGQYNYVATMGHHFELCGRTDHADRGLRLWVDSLPMLETTHVDTERYWFDLGAMVVLDHLADDDRPIEGVRADVSLGTSGQPVTVRSAKRWTESRLSTTAAGLDRRNGNDWYTATAATRRRDGLASVVTITI
jgi:hypothetical protein